MIRQRVAVLGLCAAVLAAAGRVTRGQVLADKVPADALGYVGWAGSDALGPAYDGSHLKAFVNALNLPTLVGEKINGALAANPRATEGVKFAQEILRAVGHAPTALYVGPVDLSNPAQPVPRVAVFSQVGPAQAEALAGKIQAALAQGAGQPGRPPMGAVAAGDFLLVYLGDANIRDRLDGTAAGGKALADVLAFKNAFGHLAGGGVDPAKAAAAVYVDGQAVTEMISGAVAAGPNAANKPIWAAVADGAGLNSLKQFAWAGSFDGADWHSETFLGMRDRRPGVLVLLDAGPVSAESLKLIPKTATSAGVVRFDGVRLLDDVTAAAAQVSPDAPKQIETVLTAAYVWTGIDLKRELLPGLGDEFVYYASPAATGSSLRGFTVANRLRDAKKAEAALTASENFLNMLIAQRRPNTKLQFATQVLPAPWDKVTAHVVKLGNLTPAWAINGDVFYFSTSLPGLQSAMEMGAGGKATILDNAEFVAMRKKLGRAEFGSFSFADLERTAPETYELANLVLSRAAADNPGAPAYVLPPLDKITPALGPALRVAWSDADGYHARESAPFPLARQLSPSNYVWLILAFEARQTAAAEAAAQATRPAGAGLP